MNYIRNMPIADVVLPVVASAVVVLLLDLKGLYMDHRDTLRPKRNTYTQLIIATYFGPQQYSQRNYIPLFPFCFSSARCRKGKQKLKATNP